MADWEHAVVSDVAFVMYVPPDAGGAVHTDRPYHGLVYNCADSEKKYLFSDGTVLHTYGEELFYLPQGSSYRVVSVRSGGCYAINFYSDVVDRPFSMRFRNGDAILKLFREAEPAWRGQTECYRPLAFRTVYDLILQIHRERQRAYVPSARRSLIAPAVEALRRDFAKNELSIASLALLCGLSEAYFRRIFLEEFGVSPKEYLIGLRIRYASQLLSAGDFSISETALLCGYSEPCHFSREFSRRMGMSPREYQRKKESSKKALS